MDHNNFYLYTAVLHIELIKEATSVSKQSKQNKEQNAKEAITTDDNNHAYASSTKHTTEQRKNSAQWNKLFETRDKVIQTVAKNMDLFGVTPSVGRLYGTMFFQGEPMTLDEMRDELGMSKTSMSTGVRSLMEINMVHKKWQKGVRKDLYEVEEDWYKTFIDLFTTKWQKAIEINSIHVKRALKDLQSLEQSLINGYASDSENDGSVDAELLKTIKADIAKLEHAIEYYDWLSRLVESFESGEIFNLIPKKVDEK